MQKAGRIDQLNQRLIERGPIGIVARRFLHRNNYGKRVPGWEEVNFLKLSEEVGVQYQHLRKGLTLRTPGISLKLVLRAAEALGLSMAEVGARMDACMEGRKKKDESQTGSPNVNGSRSGVLSAKRDTN